MGKVLFLLFVGTFSFQALKAEIDWANPPVMCPEEILPKELPCPDLSKVEKLFEDYPESFSSDDIKDWKANKAADLRLCRNKELLRREKEKPGTFNPGMIESAWMVILGADKIKDKLEAIQLASKKYEIPPQVLMGAMKQESLLAALGVAEDGGNFSCGMSQLNIQEWCQAMKSLSDNERAELGWPNDLSCDEEVIPTTIVKPFYDIALKKLNGRQEYELNSNDFKDILFEQVNQSFPKGNSELQNKRFQAITSFVGHCQDIKLSILFKARTLRGLYMDFVPKELREQNLYKEGATFTRSCLNPYTAKAYPLQTGWLMAVAMYNAGPRQRDIVDYYFSIKKNNYPVLTPLDLIEALHWGGKSKKFSDQLEFKNQDGDKLTQKWFKSCIVQRHVARVVQHATLPIESIAKSLDQEGCRNNGTVPDYRQKSSGKKEAK